MTEPNNHFPTDIEKEETIKFLRYGIADRKSALKKEDDRIATLDVMLNQIMASHAAEVKAYEDLEGKPEDVVDMLRKRIPHLDILDYLRVKDSDEMRSYPI